MRVVAVFCLLALVVADHHGRHESKTDGALSAPFEMKMYEALYDPYPHPMVTLTLTYQCLALELCNVRWVVSRSGVGIPVTEVGNDRTWATCYLDGEEKYTCTSHIQLKHAQLASMISAELIYSSNNTFIRFNGFSKIKNRIAENEVATYRQHIAAPMAVSHAPPRRVTCVEGENIDLRWEMVTDNRHAISKVMKKTLPDFEEECLMHFASKSDVFDHNVATHGNVDSHVMITERLHGNFHYLVEINITAAECASDAGLYVVISSEGMESWVEVTHEDSAYPAEPVITMEAWEHRVGISCGVEGQDIKSIDLYYEDELMVTTLDKAIVKGQRTENAKAVIYAHTADEIDPSEANGNYKCVVTKGDDTTQEVEQDVEFTQHGRGGGGRREGGRGEGHHGHGHGEGGRGEGGHGQGGRGEGRGEGGRGEGRGEGGRGEGRGEGGQGQGGRGEGGQGQGGRGEGGQGQGGRSEGRGEEGRGEGRGEGGRGGRQ